MAKHKKGAPEPQLFHRLKGLTTEQRNPESMDIDAQPVREILKRINAQDKKVAFAVEKEITHIARAVRLVAAALQKGGRLIYVGAGTSGRLGVLDAVECPPTFGIKPELISGMIAGGDTAMFRAQEGAEDKEQGGARDIDKKRVGRKDVVCGIAASLQTPYVVGAIKRAKKLGAKTLYVTTNPRKKLASPDFAKLAASIDVAICPEVGPEIIMGSTRMKSGTAQKLVLNMITTTAMIVSGKVYENMMVDLQLTNAKLKERAKRIIITITGISYEAAGRYLSEADGQVKTAIVMAKAGVSKPDARRRLRKANGFVRKAIGKNIAS
ncbi:MAG TPA: N-acetylmuramic acid 6-phosphate etherase [Bacteroidota bacterium]|nr:N-acetylmuramic acid 6-phosphate etherase [Bacteroidota bacterium]